MEQLSELEGMEESANNETFVLYELNLNTKLYLTWNTGTSDDHHQTPP